MVILGTFLFFALPNFQIFNASTKETNAIGKTSQLVEELKIRAVTDDRDYIMHIDLSEGFIWISDETMDEAETDDAKKKGIQFSGDTYLVGVEYPHSLPMGMDGLSIRFYKKGYSDMALIHLRKKENDITLIVEPFLPNIERKERIVSFDRCM